MSKKTIVVFCLPFYGHVNPLSGIVKELVKDYRVIVYSSEGGESDYARKVFTALGAEYKVFGKYAKRFTPDIGKDAMKAAELLMDAGEELPDVYMDELQKDNPLLIMHDAFCIWAKISASVINVPAVCVVTTFVIVPSMAASYPWITIPEFWNIFSRLPRYLKVISRYNKLIKKYNLKSDSIFDMFMNKEQLNVVFTSKELQPNGKFMDPSYVFIGPSIGARKNDVVTGLNFKMQQPLVYISLGTIFNEDTEFYRLCIEAFRNKQLNVLISAGKNVPTDKANLPENIHMEPYVDQIAVLQKASVFVTHAGMNSLNESLYFGVPMVLMPVVQEQKINAARLEELGAGKYCKRNGMTAESLFKTVEEVVSDISYKTAVQKMSKTLHEAGGVTKAISSIKKLL